MRHIVFILSATLCLTLIQAISLLKKTIEELQVERAIKCGRKLGLSDEVTIQLHIYKQWPTNEPPKFPEYFECLIRTLYYYSPATKEIMWDYWKEHITQLYETFEKSVQPIIDACKEQEKTYSDKNKPGYFYKVWKCVFDEEKHQSLHDPSIALRASFDGWRKTKCSKDYEDHHKILTLQYSKYMPTNINEICMSVHCTYYGRDILKPDTLDEIDFDKFPKKIVMKGSVEECKLVLEKAKPAIRCSRVYKTILCLQGTISPTKAGIPDEGFTFKVEPQNGK